MDIDYLYFAVVYLLHERVNVGKRIVRTVYISAPEQVYNADAHPAHVDNPDALAGAGGADVCGADYVAALVEKMIHLAAPERVIARGYEVDAA